MVWAHSLFGGGLGHRSHAFLGHGFLLFGLFVYSWEGNVAGGTELLHVLLVHVCCLETACGPSVVAHLFYIWLLRLQTRLLYLLALRVVSYAILVEVLQCNGSRQRGSLYWSYMRVVGNNFAARCRHAYMLKVWCIHFGH